MMRMMLKGMTALLLVFTATLGAMRATPYDDGGLGTQLAPPGCAQPCFLGIRPGVTGRAEALVLLRDHPWIGGITTPDDAIIAWTWNGAQPPFLHVDSESSRLLLQNGIVHSIFIMTSARMGDVKIMFGTPDITYFFNWYTRDSFKNYFSYFEQHGVYYGDQFDATSSTVCPVSTRSMWELPVILSLPASPDYSDILPVVRDAFAAVPKICR